MSVIWTHYSNRTTQQICVAQTRWKPLFSLHLVSLSLEVQFLLQCCRFQEDVLLWLMRWQSAYIMSRFFSQKTAFSPEINSNWDDGRYWIYKRQKQHPSNWLFSHWGYDIQQRCDCPLKATVDNLEWVYEHEMDTYHQISWFQETKPFKRMFYPGWMACGVTFIRSDTTFFFNKWKVEFIIPEIYSHVL